MLPPSRPFNLLRSYALVALLVMGLAGLGLSLLVDVHFERNLIALTEQRNLVLARMLSNTLQQSHITHLHEGFAGASGMAAYERFRKAVVKLVADTGVVKVRIFDDNGRISFSTRREELGQQHGQRTELQQALGGTPVTHISSRDRFYAHDELITDVSIISSYVPLRDAQSGQITGVVEIYTDAGPAIAASEEVLSRILFGAMAILLVVYLLLFMMIRRAQGLITAQQQEIIQQATHDHLTGLPNRARFNENLQHAISRARRLGQQVALLYIDLNDFKAINDTYGHHSGDALLQTLAARMREVVREYNMLARIGGDEFTLTVGGIQDSSELEALVQRLCDRISAPIELDAATLEISASIGIAFYPGDAGDCEALIRAADTAMYRAKKDPGCSRHFFTEKMDRDSRDRDIRIRELEQAIENEEFELFYQPKVDSSSGTITGAEALLRWQHPQRGRVSPLEFIPLLEETGLILKVGEWVVREACRAQYEWLQAGIEPVPVAVNVSAGQFRQPGFAGLVTAIVDEIGIDASLLEIEMTESCLMEEVEESILVLRDLKDKGFRIAIDDFGTGYSSLNYLKKFPIDTLKIDRSFITNVHNRSASDNAAIVTAIMALSHSLRLSVVAEGVESAHELAYLHALGCKTIQGFLFSQPLERPEYERLLQDSMILKSTMESIREELAVGSG